MVNIRKRGKVYQYQFEIAKVEGKHKYISKSGFKTKNEALMAGMKAYDEYINGGIIKDSQMIYEGKRIAVISLRTNRLVESHKMDFSLSSFYGFCLKLIQLHGFRVNYKI